MINMSETDSDILRNVFMRIWHELTKTADEEKFSRYVAIIEKFGMTTEVANRIDMARLADDIETAHRLESWKKGETCDY